MVVLPGVPWSVLEKDHAVAVSRHDATPLTSDEPVHHLRGRNPSVVGTAGDGVGAEVLVTGGVGWAALVAGGVDGHRGSRNRSCVIKLRIQLP